MALSSYSGLENPMRDERSQGGGYRDRSCRQSAQGHPPRRSKESVSATFGVSVHVGRSGATTALPRLSSPATVTAWAAPTARARLPGEIDKLVNRAGTIVAMLAIRPSARTAVMPGDPA